MREIKFRAWKKDIKQMFPEIYFKDFQGETIVHEQGLNEGIEICSQIYELMQFTGLKDKNGKDIYEGDIIWNGELTMDNEKILEEVDFDSDINTDGITNNCAGWSLPKGDLEIIGNIYESPELLK